MYLVNLYFYTSNIINSAMTINFGKYYTLLASIMLVFKLRITAVTV